MKGLRWEVVCRGTENKLPLLLGVSVPLVECSLVVRLVLKQIICISWSSSQILKSLHTKYLSCWTGISETKNLWAWKQGAGHSGLAPLVLGLFPELVGQGGVPVPLQGQFYGNGAGWLHLFGKNLAICSQDFLWIFPLIKKLILYTYQKQSNVVDDSGQMLAHSGPLLLCPVRCRLSDPRLVFCPGQNRPPHFLLFHRKLQKHQIPNPQFFLPQLKLTKSEEMTLMSASLLSDRNAFVLKHSVAFSAMKVMQVSRKFFAPLPPVVIF